MFTVISFKPFVTESTFKCVFSFLPLQPSSAVSFITIHNFLQINIGRKPGISAFQGKKKLHLSIFLFNYFWHIFKYQKVEKSNKK